MATRRWSVCAPRSPRRDGPFATPRTRRRDHVQAATRALIWFEFLSSQGAGRVVSASRPKFNSFYVAHVHKTVGTDGSPLLSPHRVSSHRDLHRFEHSCESSGQAFRQRAVSLEKTTLRGSHTRVYLRRPGSQNFHVG